MKFGCWELHPYAVACSSTAAWVPLCQSIPSSRNSTLMDARWVEPAEGYVSLSQHPRSLVITIFWGLVANFHGAPEHSERQRAGTGGTFPSSALGDKKSRKGQAGVNCVTITNNSYSVVLSIHADRNKSFNYYSHLKIFPSHLSSSDGTSPYMQNRFSI